MTKNILAAVGGLALVALLGASAVATFGAGEAPAARVGAISIADLPITQLVSTHTGAQTATWTMPPDAGFLLTDISDDVGGGGYGYSYTVRINSVTAWVDRGYAQGWGSPLLSPGIVVYPGSTVEVSGHPQNSKISITGYWLTLADLGM